MCLRTWAGFSIDSCFLCVTRGLLPAELVEAVWDPLSTSQTLRLVGLLSRLIQEYPTVLPSSKPLEELVSAIIAKMKSAVENDVFIPIYSKQ
jgi:GC-rich sequence DNA-binding factor